MMYLHVSIIDPASGEVVDEIGYLVRKHAIGFCKRFNAKAEKKSEEWRLAVFEEIPHSANLPT